MDINMKVGILAASLVACTGLLLAPVAGAGERAISSRYAGFGYDTSVDPNGDGLPVGVSVASSQGTLGEGQDSNTSEWYYSPHECQEGYDLPVALVNMATVTTFADHSQLFGFSQDGWLCASTVTGAYYGELHGVYGGGAGRFADASGSFTTKFEGQNLDITIGYRSFRGTTEGTLTMK